MKYKQKIKDWHTLFEKCQKVYAVWHAC